VNILSVYIWSALILSLSHALGELEFSWNTLGGCGRIEFLEQEGKGRTGKSKKESTSRTTTIFLAGIKLHA